MKLSLLCLSVLLAFSPSGPGGVGRKSSGDPSLDHRIDVALKKGTARLVEWLPYLETEKKGLVLFAALEGGASKKNPIVAAALKTMIRYRSTTTFGTSFQLMLFQKYGGGMPRRALLRAVRMLLSWQTKWGAWARDEVKYPPEARYTHYALLGLRAALKAGVPISRGILMNAADFLLRTQSPGGGFHNFIGSTQWCGNRDRDTLTAGSIGSLAICAEMAGKAGLGKSRERKMKRAMKKGLRWLEKAFERALPEDQVNLNRGLFLYALERAMDLLGEEKLGGTLWYAAGARYLLNLQMSDGSWEEDPAVSAYAVLFLARAFRPLRAVTRISPEKILARVREEAGEKAILSVVGRLEKAGLAAVPACLKILRGPSVARRKAAAMALERITGLKTGFDPGKDPALPANEEAARVWERWWMKHRKSR